MITPPSRAAGRRNEPSEKRERRLKELLVERIAVVLIHEILEVGELALEEHPKRLLLVFVELAWMISAEPPDADIARTVEWCEASLNRGYDLAGRCEPSLFRVLPDLCSQVGESRNGRDCRNNLTNAPEVLYGHSHRLTDRALSSTDQR